MFWKRILNPDRDRLGSAPLRHHSNPMKTLITLLTVVAALSFGWTAQAADADKEKEIKGEGMCLKCELKKSDACQNAIKVKEKDGKETLYVLEQNQVSKDFHRHLCTGITKVIAWGKVKKEGDKNLLVASKIEKDEKK